MPRSNWSRNEIQGSTAAVNERVMGPSLPTKNNISGGSVNLYEANRQDNNDAIVNNSSNSINANSSDAVNGPENIGKPSKVPSRMRSKMNEKLRTESAKMKMLFESSTQRKMRNVENIEPTANPLWTTFPTKCVKTISSVEEMKEKLQFFAHTDEVMVVQYSQNNCTACNAVNKVTEMLCHESMREEYKLHFYEVNKNELPELTKGLVRFPQIKGYSGGQWADIDFKPPADFRNELYSQVEKEVEARKEANTPVTALQAEEMYYSSAAPAMTEIMRHNLLQFYCKSQVRLHNYWKQISVRRSWFFKRYIAPHIEQNVRDEWRLRSVLGEKVEYGPKMPDNFES